MSLEATTTVAHPSDLTDLERERGLFAILAGTFLMYFGFFVCIPLIAVRFVDDLGWNAASVGFVLGARQITQFGLTAVGGALADRFGPKRLLLAGMFVRGVGFMTIGFAATFPVLLATTVLSSLGGALFESPRMGAITALTTDKTRARFLSLAGTVGGFGMVLGPLIGSWLFRVDFAVVCVIAGACYVLGMLLTWPLLPDVRVGQTQRLSEGLELAVRDRRFMRFVVIAVGLFVGSSQLSISLPLAAVAVSDARETAGWVYTLNALLVIALQYPLIRFLEPRAGSVGVVVIGCSLMALGFVLIGTASSVFSGMPAVIGVSAFFVAVAVFSLGQLLGLPGQQALSAHLADRRAVGSYFGVAAISQAIGGAVGSYAGGVLYGLGRDSGLTALPWIVFALIAAVTALGLSRLRGVEKDDLGRFQ